jgi:cyclophilin family peptidyl-prolyl cis-trans isomerase
MKKYLFLIFISILSFTTSCVGQNDASTVVRLETNYGNVKLKLYPETSKHRDNFLKLVEKGFYDGVLFHRVIASFMIQVGDPQSKTAKPNAMLGSGDVGYTIPAEFIYPRYYHKRGALAAAREGDQVNPKKASSGCQFYIVQGKVFTDEDLDVLEQKNQNKLEQKLFQEIVDKKQNIIKMYQQEHSQAKLDELRGQMLIEVRRKIEADTTYKFTAQQRADYKTVGGAPHLDGSYTVFGEVIEGMDVVDSIAKVQVGPNDRPVVDVRVIKAVVEK